MYDPFAKNPADIEAEEENDRYYSLTRQERRDLEEADGEDRHNAREEAREDRARREEP